MFIYKYKNGSDSRLSKCSLKIGVEALQKHRKREMQGFENEGRKKKFRIWSKS